MEVSRLSGMDNDLFTYKVEVASIPCNSVMDDDMGYDLSNVAFIEWLRSKNFNYKTMDQYTMKALLIYWIRGDDEIQTYLQRILWGLRSMMTTKMNGIYEWNKDIPWVDEKPWTMLDLCYTSSAKEALRNKAIMDGVINNDESCCELKRKWNIYTNYDDAYEINDEDNGNKELCEIQEPPVCNIRKYMMIKYLFNDYEEYVAVKGDEYDDLIMTRRDACQAYQEIFRIMDEGWMVTKAT
ncbi:hypothetical protein Tco_1395244 [Tanacetum coccineum]